MYLIGRVVVFEDPTLSAARPDLAVLRPDGSRWLNNGGLGWMNPYDRRVWEYVVDVGAARREGRVRRDPVRLRPLPQRRRHLADRLPAPAGRAEGNDDRTVPALRGRAIAPARRPRVGGRVRARGDARPGHRPGAEADRPLPRRDLPDGLPVALLLGRVRDRPARRLPGPHGRALAAGLPAPAEGHRRCA